MKLLLCRNTESLGHNIEEDLYLHTQEADLADLADDWGVLFFGDYYLSSSLPVLGNNLFSSYHFHQLPEVFQDTRGVFIVYMRCPWALRLELFLSISPARSL